MTIIRQNLRIRWSNDLEKFKWPLSKHQQVTYICTYTIVVNCNIYIHTYLCNNMYFCRWYANKFSGFILDFYFLSAACQSVKTPLFCYINICEFLFQFTYLYKYKIVWALKIKREIFKMCFKAAMKLDFFSIVSIYFFII